MNQLPPIHPGEVLREEFMAPLKLSAGAIARAVGVPRTRIERLAAEQVDLSADTALRLARLFGTSVEFWMSIQSRYAIERTSDSLRDELKQIEPLKMPA
ncbi:HigA family addiction module antitoxin [Oryzibacter oryziterrae]|uniref:HigA family addiction module antitoxin n=1 Tax=Oryzibacter oryziterrae TaxID=2766474 RepID=UPI001F01E79A|nr:HigA family addiction module antitoxin [Oryzibacter oryziterrae]